MRKPNAGFLSAILMMWFTVWSTSGICEETRAEAVVHPSNNKGPMIDAPSTSEDLGDRLAYASFSHSFKFTNVGDESLEVRIVERSCGCIGALMSDPSLEPGGTGELIIDYKRDPKMPRIGSQDFTVLVSTNDPAYPDVTFSLKFRLVHAVEASPDQVNFGNVTTETVRKFEIKPIFYSWGVILGDFAL